MLAAIRDRAETEHARLPDALRSLDAAEPYAVDVAPSLRELAKRIDAEN